MNCEKNHELIGPYVDGELDLSASLDVEQHLEHCTTCQQAHRQLRNLRSAVSTTAPYYKAPAGFIDQMRSQLNLAPQTSVRRPVVLRYLAAAAALLLIASITAVLIWQNHQGTDALSRELVAAHVRSTLADHLLDVVSSDQHTVKPWFSGKLDFSPLVLDFADDGFKLEGARLDYIAGRPVAALVYRHNRHAINCFVWPANQPESAIGSASSQGYTLTHFDHINLTWHIVSDASAETIERLANLIRAAH